MLAISLAAEKIGSIGGFPVTNSLLSTWIAMGVLFFLSWAATRKLSLVPSTIQSIAEVIIGGLYDFFSAVSGHYISKFFPLVASLFIFIMTANWMGLLPGFGTVGIFHTPKAVHESAPVTESVTETEATPVKDQIHVQSPAVPAAPVTEHTQKAEGTGSGASEPAGVTEKEAEVEFKPIFRASTADLNMTLALALIAVIAIQYFGFQVVGFHYSSKFINFKNPIEFVLGILEFLSELSRIISFTFRLFGNIFAGEVLLAVMAFLMPFIVPLPFLMLELFVGFIQALVFSMLTAVFLNVAVSHGKEH